MTNVVVHKFQLSDGRANTLPLPVGAVVRHVGVQNSLITLWIELDTDAAIPVELRSFEILATGEPVDPGRAYVGTVMPGQFVFHVYERTS